MQKNSKDGIKEHTIYSSLSEEKNAAFELTRQGEYDKIREEELGHWHSHSEVQCKLTERI